MLVAFSVALKHKLRFEPYSNYQGLGELIDHLETFAKSATEEGPYQAKQPNIFKDFGDRLGVSFAASNPRKTIKKATSPTGNLPLEILCYLSAYADEVVSNGQLPIPMTQTNLCKFLSLVQSRQELELTSKQTMVSQLSTMFLRELSVSSIPRCRSPIPLPSPRSPGLTSSFCLSSSLVPSGGSLFRPVSSPRTSSLEFSSLVVRSRIHLAPMSTICR